MALIDHHGFDLTRLSHSCLVVVIVRVVDPDVRGVEGL
jgi:hypothetical protein